MSTKLKGLKALMESRGELETELKGAKSKQRKLAAKVQELGFGDRTAEDWNEKFAAATAEMNEVSEEIERLETELKELDDVIKSVKESEGYTAVPVETAEDGNDDNAEDEFAEAGSDGAELLSGYEWSTGWSNVRRSFSGDERIARPANAQSKPESSDNGVEAKYFASKDYETLFRAWTREVGRVGQAARSFAQFARDYAAQNTGFATLVDAVAGIGIPLFPMRIIDLFECECDDWFFVEQLATRHVVTDACSLEIWKRGDKVSSFAWGCVCKDIPKSGVPTGPTAKVLQPWMWSQGAKICREQLLCTAIDPLMLLFRDMEEERMCAKEYSYFYGDGFQKPLGLWVDTAVPVYTFMAEEFDGDGRFVDPEKSLLRMYKAYPSKCRRRADNVWVMKDSLWCDFLETATQGDGCCKNGLQITQEVNGDALRTFLSAPGVPRRPVYVIDDEVCAKLPEGHPARDIEISFGSWRSYHIADFAMGRGLETDVDIETSEQCWVQRGYLDALMTCPEKMLLGQRPTGELAAALKGIAPNDRVSKLLGALGTPREAKVLAAVKNAGISDTKVKKIKQLRSKMADVAIKYAPSS